MYFIHLIFYAKKEIPILTYGANSFQVNGHQLRYGNKRYGITIPVKIRGKGEKLYGKEVTVIVILPDDE